MGQIITAMIVAALSDLKITGNELKVFLVIALTVLDKPEDGRLPTYWENRSTLEHKVGMNSTAVRDALRGLVAKGWLLHVERGKPGNTARYRVNVPKLATLTLALDDAHPTSLVKGSGKAAPFARNGSGKPARMGAENPLAEDSIENSTNDYVSNVDRKRPTSAQVATARDLGMIIADDVDAGDAEASDVAAMSRAEASARIAELRSEAHRLWHNDAATLSAATYAALSAKGKQLADTREPAHA